MSKVRLIDANALIKEFLRLADDEWNQKTGATWARGFEESAEVVEDAPTIDPAKWIPCKERLPRYQEVVLISIRANGVGVGYLELDDYSSDILWVVADNDFYDGDEFELVEAWMPLPMPWKGEEP